MNNAYDLSIVIPTRNRAIHLEQCIAAMPAACDACRYELIIVDGASDDGTAEVCKAAQERWGDDLTYIREDEPNGFVKAANLGFRAAKGQYLTWVNDDAKPLSHCYDHALGQIASSPEDVGLLALFSPLKVDRSVAYQTVRLGEPYKLMHVRGTLYANFGLGPRSLFEKLGYYDERYFICGADPDFSLKVWHAGYRVVPAFDALIDHHEEEDATRESSFDYRASDNQALFAKWDLPPANPSINDFDPMHPCTLKGLKE